MGTMKSKSNPVGSESRGKRSKSQRPNNNNTKFISKVTPINTYPGRSSRQRIAANENAIQRDLFAKKKLSLSAVNNVRPWEIFASPLITESACKYTHVSLFSGCGGFDLGLRQAGFRTVFANDIQADACSTYRKNLGEIVEADIESLSLPRFIRRPDVLTAGFPCQPFSNAGSRKGVHDDRGSLFQTAIDIVSDVKPKSFIFENVRGILSFRHGNRLLIHEICEKLDALGYDVVFRLIDASRHHVPQKRFRVIIVGTDKSNRIGKFSFPSAVVRGDLTLKHTIFDLTNKHPNQTELMTLNPQAIKIGAMVPEGGSWKDIPYRRLPERLKRVSDNIKRYRWPNFYRRFHRNEIAGTVTAAFKPENAGVWHPVKKRVLSVREIARIQTFPDWFAFEGRSIKSKYQQIGNAVPPRLAYELAIQLKSVLEGKDVRVPANMMTFDQFMKTGKPLRTSDRDVVFSVYRERMKAKKA